MTAKAKLAQDRNWKLMQIAGARGTLRKVIYDTGRTTYLSRLEDLLDWLVVAVDEDWLVKKEQLHLKQIHK